MDGHDGAHGGHGGHGGDHHGPGHAGDYHGPGHGHVGSVDHGVIFAGSSHPEFTLIGLGGLGAPGGHATYEAMVLSYAFSGHGHGHASFSHSHGGGKSFGPAISAYSHVAGSGSQQGTRGENEDCSGTCPPDPQCPPDPMQRTFVDHVMGHGPADVMSLVAEISKMCPELRLVRLDNARPNMDSVYDVKLKIADWDAWVSPYDGKVMPAGYYPNATGRTILERQYWQVGRVQPTWKGWAPVQYDETAATYLQVDVTQWDYYEAGDFETKFEVRVISLPVFDPYNQVYGIRRDPFFTHQKVGRELARRIFERLKATPPNPVAVALRNKIYAAWDQTGHESDPPQMPDEDFDGRAPTPAEEVAADQAAVDKAAKDDAAERSNASTTPAPSGPTPADNSDADGGDEGFVPSAAHRQAVSGADVNSLFAEIPEVESIVARTPQGKGIVTADQIESGTPIEIDAAVAVAESVAERPAKVAVTVHVPR